MNFKVSVKNLFYTLSCSLFILLSIQSTNCSAQVTTYFPTDDAMVYRGNATNNYGTDIKLQVKKAPSSTLTRNVYLKFDLAGVTAPQVGKAILRLYCNNKAFDSVHTIIGLFATTNTWTESAITWNNAPTLTSFLTSNVIAPKLQYYDWDVTEYIKQGLASSAITSIGVADLQESNNLIEFSSKEAVNKPQLIINAQADPVVSTYFIDALNGDDANNGSTAATPFKNLSRLNNLVLSPGTKVFLKSGQTYTGLLNITSNGTAAAPIIYTSYGGTEPAIIDGQGKMAAVFAYNRGYFELRNIAVTNFRNAPVKSDDPFSGILFVNEDGGTLHHITLDSVKINRVNSGYNEDTSGTVYNGGLQFFATGTRVASNWNDVLVQNCTFTNLSRTGFNFRSDWDLRNSNTTYGQNLGDGRLDNWFPSTNVLIQNNYFKNIAGNGLIVRVAKHAVVQGNLFDSCGTIISGNATFTFNTDSTIYQFNEAKNTIYNDGDTDARGIDADFRTKATVIQYNYLHNNGLGGVVATGGDQTTGQIPERFNITSVIRYNLIENNDRQAIAFSGAINGLDIYNNTCFADATHTDVTIVRSAIWAVAPKNLRFKNNIFYFLGANPSYSFASGSTYNFTNNLFYGVHPATEPADANKITADPKLLSTGNGPNGYKYLAGSSALNSGVLISNNGGRDYFGNAVTNNTNPNVGMYNGPAVSPTPVTLLNFLAKKIDGATLLTWSTTMEINTFQFYVERSLDGIAFKKIATLSAAGNSSSTTGYSFTDHAPVKGINYYRVCVVDIDGSRTYSEVRIINHGSKNNSLIVYPNPATKSIYLHSDSFQRDDVIVRIVNIEGKKILEQNFSAGSDLKLNTSHLIRGIYSVELVNKQTSFKLGNAKFLKL